MWTTPRPLPSPHQRISHCSKFQTVTFCTRFLVVRNAHKHATESPTPATLVPYFVFVIKLANQNRIDTPSTPNSPAASTTPSHHPTSQLVLIHPAARGLLVSCNLLDSSHMFVVINRLNKICAKCLWLWSFVFRIWINGKPKRPCAIRRSKLELKRNAKNSKTKRKKRPYQKRRRNSKKSIGKS